MEYDCLTFSKDLVFQMRNLVFQSKYVVLRSKILDFDRNTGYFESEILKYKILHTMNLSIFSISKKVGNPGFLMDFMYIL